MSEISQKEFEENIELLIVGKTTKEKMCKNLGIDRRTLDARIQKLAALNPDLYDRYVRVLPYKQKVRDNINYEALLTYMLKEDITISEAANQFGVSIRTIQRRINELENKELVKLYKEVASNRKRSKVNSTYITQAIGALKQVEESEIILGDINDSRERYLLQIEAQYNELCKTMTTTEAAKKMGFKDRDRLYKLINELYRLKIEKQHSKTSQQLEQEKSFKEKHRVDVPPLKVDSISAEEIIKQNEKERE